MLSVEEVILEGKIVRLIPVDRSHVEGIWEAGRFEEIWRFTSDFIQTKEDAIRYVDKLLQLRDAGKDLPFTIITKKDNKIVGNTRFLNISRDDQGLEIGGTWLTPSVWKTAVNTECKWLLLRHCFEQLGCLRVQIKTDARNENSQRAIARIGAQKEGVLRKHMHVRDGYIRDTVMFSIIDEEWPSVDRKLREMLDNA
ncbi:GNAT family N-acetyltransferase [Brevibacillus migulae]|uniref:GNAT family N-acetyltransferase n=1 Tax=Brevibacillus migulae TaxID=1644114 RepID=UPI00106E73CC|nr:GNAT family protein [Brevibacillus migulae]